MMAGFSSRLYYGQVMHRRLRPFGHRFGYRVFSLYLDLDELDRLDRELPFFSHNRFNLFSLHDRDHGARDGGPLRPWIESWLGRFGIDLEGGSIKMLCFPRILGYVFNPLSLWFCYHRDGRLMAVLYEVRNTFGDKHGYLIPLGNHAPGTPILQSCEKAMHVSPFMEMKSRYAFRLREPDERLSILIRQFTADGETLIATHTGRAAKLTGRELLKAFVLHPLMTMKVMGAIHWEAFRLWRKGAVFHRRPAPPADDVELIETRISQAAE